jgi:hypothetical protein
MPFADFEQLRLLKNLRLRQIFGRGFKNALFIAEKDMPSFT